VLVCSGQKRAVQTSRGFFGDRLLEVRAAMETFAASFAPEELNRIGFRFY
jgi:hypothetical protein